MALNVASTAAKMKNRAISCSPFFVSWRLNRRDAWVGSKCAVFTRAKQAHNGKRHYWCCCRLNQGDKPTHIGGTIIRDETYLQICAEKLRNYLTEVSPRLNNGETFIFLLLSLTGMVALSRRLNEVLAVIGFKNQTKHV